MVDLRLERFDEAVRHVKRALEIRLPRVDADPAGRRIHSLLTRPVTRMGIAYQRLGQLVLAIETYEMGLRRLSGYHERTGDASLDDTIEEITEQLAHCRMASAAQ
jgi:hypothetical protein